MLSGVETMVVFGEQHLLLHLYQRYYNEVRTHLSLHKEPREVRAAGLLSVPILGRLHHQCL
jgi:hypothetical protein